MIIFVQKTYVIYSRKKKSAKKKNFFFVLFCKIPDDKCALLLGHQLLRDISLLEREILNTYLESALKKIRFSSLGNWCLYCSMVLQNFLGFSAAGCFGISLDLERIWFEVQSFLGGSGGSRFGFGGRI